MLFNKLHISELGDVEVQKMVPGNRFGREGLFHQSLRKGRNVKSIFDGIREKN